MLPGPTRSETPADDLSTQRSLLRFVQQLLKFSATAAVVGMMTLPAQAELPVDWTEKFQPRNKATPAPTSPWGYHATAWRPWNPEQFSGGGALQKSWHGEPTPEAAMGGPHGAFPYPPPPGMQHGVPQSPQPWGPPPSSWNPPAVPPAIAPGQALPTAVPPAPQNVPKPTQAMPGASLRPAGSPAHPLHDNRNDELRSRENSNVAASASQSIATSPAIPTPSNESSGPLFAPPIAREEFPGRSNVATGETRKESHRAESHPVATQPPQVREPIPRAASRPVAEFRRTRIEPEAVANQRTPPTPVPASEPRIRPGVSTRTSEKVSSLPPQREKAEVEAGFLAARKEGVERAIAESEFVEEQPAGSRPAARPVSPSAGVSKSLAPRATNAVPQRFSRTTPAPVVIPASSSNDDVWPPKPTQPKLIYVE